MRRRGHKRAVDDGDVAGKDARAGHRIAVHAHREGGRRVRREVAVQVDLLFYVVIGRRRESRFEAAREERQVLFRRWDELYECDAVADGPDLRGHAGRLRLCERAVKMAARQPAVADGGPSSTLEATASSSAAAPQTLRRFLGERGFASPDVKTKSLA